MTLGWDGQYSSDRLDWGWMSPVWPHSPTWTSAGMSGMAGASLPMAPHPPRGSSGLSIAWCPLSSQQEERTHPCAQGLSSPCLCLLMPRSSLRVQRSRPRGACSSWRPWVSFMCGFGILAFASPPWSAFMSPKCIILNQFLWLFPYNGTLVSLCFHLSFLPRTCSSAGQI